MNPDAPRIPDDILRFVDEQANIGFAGTRNASLVPLGHRVSGWRIAADGKTLTAFLPNLSVARFLEAVADNGQVAIVVEEVGTHETYQMKGRYLRHRPTTPEEVGLSATQRERFVEGLRRLYPHPGLPDLMRASIPDATTAVDVDVQEVFLQTPRPGAGRRVWPEERGDR